MATPNLGLPTIPNGNTYSSAAFNDAMQLIDAMTPLIVLDKDLASPPTTTSADIGKRWIVAASPTGDWTGHAGDVALCTGENLWRFISPKDGYKAFVVDEAEDYRYLSGTWSIV